MTLCRGRPPKGKAVKTPQGSSSPSTSMGNSSPLVISIGVLVLLLIGDPELAPSCFDFLASICWRRIGMTTPAAAALVVAFWSGMAANGLPPRHAEMSLGRVVPGVETFTIAIPFSTRSAPRSRHSPSRSGASSTRRPTLSRC